MTPKIATITLNPAIDQTASIPNFRAGEVNRVEWEQSDPGGKGVNVASFLTNFGYSTVVSGFLGSDNAEIFEKFFTQQQIEDRFIRIAGKTRVNVKIVDAVQQKITDVNFPGQTAAEEDIAMLMQMVNALMTGCDWFILAGSVPMGVSSEIYAELTQRLKSKGKTVVLDASGESLRQALVEPLQGKTAVAPYAIKPNIDELQELLNRSLTTETEIVKAAQDLLAIGIHCIAVSMGAKGAIFVETDQAVLARPPKVEVVSTVGAGDAMVSGLVTGKLRGLALADCARLATAFSMGALTQFGPRLPPQKTIESLMSQVVIQPLH